MKKKKDNDCFEPPLLQFKRNDAHCPDVTCKRFSIKWNGMDG